MVDDSDAESVVYFAMRGCRIKSPAVSWVRKEQPAYGSIPQRVGVKPLKKFTMPEAGVALLKAAEVADIDEVAARVTEDVSTCWVAEPTGGGCSW